MAAMNVWIAVFCLCDKQTLYYVYQNTAQEPGKQSSLDLAAAISGGVLLALLALFAVVITVVSCWCIKKRKQGNKKNQQRL